MHPGDTLPPVCETVPIAQDFVRMRLPIIVQASSQGNVDRVYQQTMECVEDTLFKCTRLPSFSWRQTKGTRGRAQPPKFIRAGLRLSAAPSEPSVDSVQLRTCFIFRSRIRELAFCCNHLPARASVIDVKLSGGGLTGLIISPSAPGLLRKCRLLPCF